LYDRIYQLDVLTAAWAAGMEKNGVRGSMPCPCQDIVERPGAAQFLQDLQEELRAKRYRPQPVWRQYTLSLSK
jgi:hypothetical protein